MRVCPNCNREWPDQANFCPMDGTVLHADKAPPPQARSSAPRSAAPRSGAARPTGEATRVVQEATRRSAPSPRAEAATVVTASPLANQTVITNAPEGMGARRAPAHSAPTVETPTAPPDETPTVMAMPAVTDADISHSADTAEVPPGDEAAEEQGKHFSETAWFMAAADIESMEELDDDIDVSAMEERYLREGRNPTQVRQKFSLTITDAPDEVKEVIEEIRKKPAKKPRK